MKIKLQLHAGVPYTTTAIFDSHITAVTNASGVTVTTSGSNFLGDSGLGTYTVTLESGYVLDTVVMSKTDRFAIENIGETSFVVVENSDWTISGSPTITLTSKQSGGGDKMNYDLSTSTKWANLSDGDHTVQIIAKADGYRASEPSESVTVSKGGSNN